MKRLLLPSILLVSICGMITARAQINYEPYAITTRVTAHPFFFIPDVAVDPAGNLYVADFESSIILKVSPDGRVRILAGQPNVPGSSDGQGGAAHFFGPEGLTIDRQNNLYVSDSANCTIRKVTPSGLVTTLAGLAGQSGSSDGTGSDARFNYPADVSADAAGNIYVADTRNDTIRKINSAGVVTTLAGLAGQIGYVDGTGSGARFYYPSGVAADQHGNVFVADSYNDTIRSITPAAVVRTIAGSPLTPGSTDGTGSQARFYIPDDVAVDAAGNLYIADTFNRTIRKMTPDREVTTLAGVPGMSGQVDGTGSGALFEYPSGITLDRSGTIYVADYSIIRVGVPAQ